jgi:hypothetical protein
MGILTSADRDDRFELFILGDDEKKCSEEVDTRTYHSLRVDSLMLT